MTSSKQTENQFSAWQFTDRKRWKIIAILETKTPLHIGSGEPFTVEVIDSRGKPKKVEANGFIKDRGTDQGAKPIIPGSTLKGKLRSYIAGSIDSKLCEMVFGKGYANEEDQGNGGVAEFHDAGLCHDCQEGSHYPQWNQEKQTWIEASTAIDRHTGTALDASLHYTECVAPGTCFKVIVTGDMRDQEATLIIKALEIFQDTGNTLSLGAETANGNGRMMLAREGITVGQLDHGGIITWLAADSTGNLAGNCLRKLIPNEIKSLTAALPSLSRKSAPLAFDITLLQFNGPFLINDPARMKGTDREIHHQPLINRDNEPIFPAKSFRGAFRSQAERIIRTMGGHCCDSREPCRQEEVEDLCLACKMFGATGWKTTLHIDNFKYICSLAEGKQQFVAIDRFHGGGKDGALFTASYFECPEFSGKISLDIRKEDPGELAWRKGLLALLFRDLQEGDISFGFGMNKDYGTVKKVDINNLEKITAQDIEAFRSKCLESSAEYPCAAIPVPNKIDNRPELPAINPAEGETNVFHNPYHFIPVKKPDVSTWLKKNELAGKTSPHSHACYRSRTDDGQKLYHGRITCRLTAETPFFVGRGDAPKDQQGDESKARLKKHYRLNGKIAIPATSLRGMISSLAEAASNSAMRVLDNGLLSYRKTAEQALKTIGLLYTKKDGGWHLVPLSKEIRLKNVYGQNQNLAMHTFIDECHSWSPDHNVVYYLSGTNPNEIPVKDYTRGKKCGILRILGAQGREKSMENKKHELFLEVDRKYVDTERNRFDYAAFIKDHDHSALKVSKEAVECYQQLADQRSKSQKSNRELKKDKDCASPQWLPFHLKGGKRKRKDEYCVLPLREYDLVYFRSEGKTVTEIAFSAIWRDKLQHSVNNFLPASELQPFNRARTKISPAELLFGFVELNKDEDKRDHSLAYAGKVKISAGRLSARYQGMKDSELQDGEIPLKALSSPKLPSPALYFKKRNGTQAYTAKTDLNAQTEEIQGRKIYLHALRRSDHPDKVKKISPKGLACNSGQRDWPWISQNREPDREKLKVRIKPVKKNTSFDFSINFNNLTEWELGLLCYALRPDETFRHKLGMGKPIGLGTVKIDILSLQTIDRNKRYGVDSITEERYNGGVWMAGDPDLPVTDNETVLSLDRLREVFTETMEPDIQRVIQLLGNPHNIRYPVHYPQVRDTNIETENFNWFVANDFGSGQNANKLDAEQKLLNPVSQSPGTIPTLNRYERNG